ncbi:MAG: hypothetical protein ABJA82_01465 [Myxococcales bacterium]
MLISACCVATLGCGGGSGGTNGSGGNRAGTGGSSHSGGANGSGGSSEGSGGRSGSTGGADASGGSSAGSGGRSSTGGADASGGSGAGTGGRSSSGGANGSGGSSAGSGGRSSSGGASASGGSGAGMGGATGTSIAGMVSGKPFNSAMTALWIGMPDANNPAVTVVYLFDMPVKCSVIGAAGWDAALGNSNQVLELKAAGTTPGTYRVKGGNPTALAAGEAVVNHSVLMTTPVEQIAAAGSTVTLTALNAGKNATGSFDIMFPNGSLKGTFDAMWCATGREP